MKGQQKHRRLFPPVMSSMMVHVFFVFAVILFIVNPVKAEDDGFCVPIHAKIQSFFVVEGCDSPVDLCTVGEITEGGLLNGSTFFTAGGVAPSAGMPDVEPETTLSYSGVLTVTTKLGTITIRDVGVFETARGSFSELDRIIEGSGRFSGARGTLFIFGYATADGAGFAGTIRGEICLMH